MRLFRRKSRVPNLEPEQYQAVVDLFAAYTTRSEQHWVDWQARQDSPNADAQALNFLHAYNIVKSFIEFAVVPLEDVYVFHSHSPFLPFAATFAIEAESVYRSDDLRVRVNIHASQGAQIGPEQISIFMQPYFVERLGLGGEPSGMSNYVKNGPELRSVCHHIVVATLLTAWVELTEREFAPADTLGLACGWVLVQWAEWSVESPELFELDSPRD